MPKERESFFCKFCGEKVEYLDDLNDFYCTHCHSFQTTNQPSIRADGLTVKEEQLDLPIEDKSLPPNVQPEIPKAWLMNLPIFRHREYVVKSPFSFRIIYNFYNIHGQKLGDLRSEVFNFKGCYTLHDLDGESIFTVERRRRGFWQSKYEIRDMQSKYIGAIRVTSPFLQQAIYEILDNSDHVIAKSMRSGFFRINYNMNDPSGEVAIDIDNKHWSGTMKISIISDTNPLLVLVYCFIRTIIVKQQQNASMM